jgi:lipid-binding SYLF domain-containing protein
MKNVVIGFVATWLVMASPSSWSDEVQDFSKTIELFQQSPLVQQYFDTAYGYALFPLVGKGSFIVGYTRGTGQVYRGDFVTGFSTVNHVSLGFQGGAQVYSQVIFFQDKRAYDEFTQGSFEVDSRAAAVAVTAGAQAQAGSTGVTSAVSSGSETSTQKGSHYAKGMAIFVQSKGGLMLDVSAGVQKFSFLPVDPAVPMISALDDW